MIIEIKGVQFVNKGAELMLHAVLAQVAEHWPDARIALAPNTNSPYSKRARLGALQKFSLRRSKFDLNHFSHWLPKRLRRFLISQFGIVLECDIDLLLDASGFGYGDAWGETKSRQLGSEVSRFAKRGARYIFLPQAFGPFTLAGHGRHLAKALPKAALICARETQSAAHLTSLVGRKPANLQVHPDFTNLVEGYVPAYFSQQVSAEPVLIIPNNAMVGARNKTHAAWKSRYIEVMCSAIQAALNLGYQPVLLNHEGADDKALCEQLNQHFGGRLELIEEECPLAVKGMIGASKAVVCSRFHGCVSALSQGVACLGTSWNHKYEALFDEYQRSDYLLRPDVNDETLQRLLESSIGSVDDADYQAAISSFTSQTRQMWQQVVEHAR